jgi:hypothetical protein
VDVIKLFHEKQVIFSFISPKEEKRLLTVDVIKLFGIIPPFSIFPYDNLSILHGDVCGNLVGHSHISIFKKTPIGKIVAI